jgi:AcrR family transcriptional regulator
VSVVKRKGTSRSYVSPVRDEHARQVRLEVLSAAERLFLDQGFAATSMEQVARAAGVTRQTVHAIGNKAELFKLVRDRLIAGDDEPVSMPEREEHTAFTRAATAADALRAYAVAGGSINGRYARISERLREAAATEPGLAALWSTAEQQRLFGARMAASTVAGLARLRPGLTQDRAAEAIWALTGPENYQRLVHDRGWTCEEYVDWLARSFEAILLGDD